MTYYDQWQLNKYGNILSTDGYSTKEDYREEEQERAEIWTDQQSELQLIDHE